MERRINEFVVRFANVNGTGSASANGLFAKSLFRMGLPIGPKNMFPSNIQGLPTWYEVRVSEKGYTGRRGGVDLMVAMNPQTFAKDTESVDRGGFLLYDSTRPIDRRKLRDDIRYLPLPITKLCLDMFPDSKSRAMLKNVVYVGALAALLQMDRHVVENLLEEQYGRKKHLLAANHQAFDIGWKYAQDTFTEPFPLKASSLVRDGAPMIMSGNEAAGLGCVYGGATVAAWYPITPSTSLVDQFERYSEKLRKTPEGENQFAIIQAEDELAAIGMVLGAGWNGARAFTATSGPGVSLMSEFLGYAYYAEIPTVLFNIQRVGPSTGMPTRTQQADLISSAYASHGDTKHVLLIPGTIGECFEFAGQSFALAERLQTPVIVMSDLELGMNDFMSEPLRWAPEMAADRGKVLDEKALDELKKPYYRYEDVDGDAIPYRTLPGTHPSKGAGLTRGSGHDRYGRYTEDGELYQDNLDRIARKIDSSPRFLPEPAVSKRSGASIGIVATGILWEPLREALDLLEEQGVKADLMRIRSFPFHPQVATFLDQYDTVVVVDQNRDGQLRSMLSIELEWDPKKLKSVRTYDGMPPTALDLKTKILEQIGDGGKA